MRPDRVLGAVLAGGASSRFGSDKAAAMLGGHTLLARAGAILAGIVDEVTVVGRAGGVPDLPTAGLGPLGGIAGALDDGARRGFASVVTIACDMPDVPEALLAALLGTPPCYCVDAPVLGHWPVALRDDLVARLASSSASSGRTAQDGPDGARQHRSGTLSVRRWASHIGAVAVSSPLPLRNINTIADLLAS